MGMEGGNKGFFKICLIKKPMRSGKWERRRDFTRLQDSVERQNDQLLGSDKIFLLWSEISSKLTTYYCIATIHSSVRIYASPTLSIGKRPWLSCFTGSNDIGTSSNVQITRHEYNNSWHYRGRSELSIGMQSIKVTFYNLIMKKKPKMSKATIINLNRWVYV